MEMKMLINTVILFLQNALPIFVMITVLLITLSPLKENKITLYWLMRVIPITMLFTIILSQKLEDITQTFDGAGLELLLSVVYILVYVVSIVLFINDKTYRKKYLALFLLFAITSVNGAHFIVYLTNYWNQTNQFESMFVGIILGGGICLSISILLFFMLNAANKHLYSHTSRYFLLLFSVGQLMHAVALLQQVDLLPSSQAVWDSSLLIQEQSEVGHLLTVLFGYESSPSALQCIIYIIALFAPVMVSKLISIRIKNRGDKPC